jgi:hypothetical protein
MSMRLYEFTDVSSYTLSADEMAAIIEEVKQVWRGNGIGANAPLFPRIMDQPVVS